MWKNKKVQLILQNEKKFEDFFLERARSNDRFKKTILKNH